MVQKNLWQGWNRDADAENGHADMGKGRWSNWENSTAIYTLLCGNRQLGGAC